MAEEVHELRAQMRCPQGVTTSPGATFLAGTLDGAPVVSVLCGIGKVSAAAAAAVGIERYRPTALVVSGISGSLSDGVPHGALVVATAAIQHDFDARPLLGAPGQLPGRPGPEIQAEAVVSDALRLAAARLFDPGLTPVLSGTVCSGDQIVASGERREAIAARFPSALCVDMETAAVAQVCEAASLPWAALRMISDGADESFSSASVLSWCASVAAPAMASVVAAALADLPVVR